MAPGGLLPLRSDPLPGHPIALLLNFFGQFSFVESEGGIVAPAPRDFETMTETPPRSIILPKLFLAGLLTGFGPGPFALGDGAAFLEPEVYGVGVVAFAHRFVDLDLDGALDLVAVSNTNAMILPGRKQSPPPEARFRQGDADGDGSVVLSDAVLILNWLFRGGPSPACADAADADDSGAVNLTDAIRIPRWLLQGGEPPPAPGPASCGADSTPDSLARCQEECRP